MNNKHSSDTASRENFLMSLLNKVASEYKALLNLTRRTKPLKIVKIVHLSKIPGESVFAIQITNKNCFLTLSAAQIINDGYQLSDFNEYHADIIRQAALGKLIEFLKLSDCEPRYKIVAKKFDKAEQQHFFTLQGADQQQFVRSAEEIAGDKMILKNLCIEDVYDVGYTQGSEGILREKLFLMLKKKK